jgi:hypothetical protein
MKRPSLSALLLVYALWIGALGLLLRQSNMIWTMPLLALIGFVWAPAWVWRHWDSWVSEDPAAFCSTLLVALVWVVVLTLDSQSHSEGGASTAGIAMILTAPAWRLLHQALRKRWPKRRD